MKGTNKKKKSKKSSKHKAEWDLDGGAEIRESSDTRGKSPFGNQERDERIRRGRIKAMYHKESRESAAKMNSKVKLSDVFPSPSIPDMPKSAPKKKLDSNRSQLSAYERLKHLVHRDTANDNTDYIQQKEPLDETVQTNMIDLSSTPQKLAETINESLVSTEDFSAALTLLTHIHDWVFEQLDSHSAFPSTAQDQLTPDIPGSDKSNFLGDLRVDGTSVACKLFARFNVSVSELSACARLVLDSFRSLRGLPKPWNSISESEAESSNSWCRGSSIGRQLLPFLSTYADAFLETYRRGCDEGLGSPDTEDLVLEAILFHIAVHTVRSR